ncbi:MAG: hypothetical protein DMD26_01655 [Gemmatimonadetes bacterium]|nr:MAG: hypothetical protein DMD26_01655 [Gemmatimonadota bacterium]
MRARDSHLRGRDTQHPRRRRARRLSGVDAPPRSLRRGGWAFVRRVGRRRAGWSRRVTTDPSPSARDAALDTLGRYRQQIEQLDRDLVSLLAKRVALSKEIGAMKRVAGLPTLDPAREAEVIRRAAALARDASLNDEKVRDIFWHVIGLSRAVQVDE